MRAEWWQDPGHRPQMDPFCWVCLGPLRVDHPRFEWRCPCGHTVVTKLSLVRREPVYNMRRLDRDHLDWIATERIALLVRTPNDTIRVVSG